MSSEVKRHLVMAGSEVSEMVLASDYAALKAECEQLHLLCEDRFNEIAQLHAELAHVRTALAMHDRIEKDTYNQCERTREALEWYAEKVKGCRKIGADGDNARQALDLDGGFRALDALAVSNKQEVKP